MKPSPVILAFLWLTIGYWIISFIVPLALLFLPFAKSSGGISTSMADGVYKIQFSGSPGQSLLVSTDTGEKQASFSGILRPLMVHLSGLSGRARHFSLSLLSFSPQCLFQCCVGCSATGLTNRWSQPLAAVLKR